MLQLKDLCCPFSHFMDWLTGTPIKIQLLFYLCIFIICCFTRQECMGPFPGTLAPPREDWVRKGCDKLALGGNAKQRFWHQATWNPCKTAMCLAVAMWFQPWTREEKKLKDTLTLLIPDEWCHGKYSHVFQFVCTVSSSPCLFMHGGDDSSQMQILIACSVAFVCK